MVVPGGQPPVPTLVYGQSDTGATLPTGAVEGPGTAGVLLLFAA